MVLFVATGHNLRRPLIRIRQVLPVVLLRLLLLALFSYGSSGFVIVLRIEPVLVGTAFLHGLGGSVINGHCLHQICGAVERVVDVLNLVLVQTKTAVLQ